MAGCCGIRRSTMPPAPNGTGKRCSRCSMRRSDRIARRRDFLKQIGLLGIGLSAGPVLTGCASRRAHLTILHTADIHAQLATHDEFFWENGKPVFRRRGGFATLRTMLDAL